MENYTKNQAKKLCRLYYRDKILTFADEGKSIREITELINKKYIPKSRFKGTTLSKDIIHNIIKKARK
jgi:hypothetical protein